METENNEQPTNGSTESAWLFFTECHYKGKRFNLTIREGTDSGKIPGILNRMIAVYEAEASLGFTLPKDPSAKPSAPVTPPATPDQPAAVATVPYSPPRATTVNKGSVDAARPGDVKGLFHITKIKITGEEDNPKVEFFTPNTKLAHAVIFGPAKVVDPILNKGVAEENQPDMSWLYRCGKKYDVDWTVAWVISSKQSSTGKPYRDITEIVSHKVKADEGGVTIV